MNTSVSSANAALEERFGRRVAQRLSVGTAELPHDFSERLRAARVQAVARRKMAAPVRTAPAVFVSGKTVALGGGGGGWWWNRVGAIVPLIALVVGLFTISAMQDDNHASEAAEIDAALLTDDLPPSAFTDPGFAQFLKSDASSSPAP